MQHSQKEGDDFFAGLGFGKGGEALARLVLETSDEFQNFFLYADQNFFDFFFFRKQGLVARGDGEQGLS